MTVTVGIATTGEHPAVLLRTVLHAIDSAAAVSADAEVLVVVNGRDSVPDLAVVNSPAMRVVTGIALSSATVKVLRTGAQARASCSI